MTKPEKKTQKRSLPPTKIRPQKKQLVGDFTTFEKYESKWVHLPQIRGNIKKIFELPPPKQWFLVLPPIQPPSIITTPHSTPTTFCPSSKASTSTREKIHGFSDSRSHKKRTGFGGSHIKKSSFFSPWKKELSKKTLKIIGVYIYIYLYRPWFRRMFFQHQRFFGGDVWL